MVRIRLGTPEDAPYLPAIEHSAGERFRTIPSLAWVADNGEQPEHRHRQLIALGTEWVAVDDAGRLIAFLSTEIVGGALHIWEFAVELAHQGRGIGRAMIETAAAFAVERGLPTITLTTFRDLAWNERFYHRLGFVTLTADELGDELRAIVARETEHGLPPERRCAMRRVL